MKKTKPKMKKTKPKRASCDDENDNPLGLRPGTPYVHGTTMTWAEMLKLQHDHKKRFPIRSHDAATGNPLPSPVLRAEVSQLVKVRGLVAAAALFGVEAESVKRIAKGLGVLKRTLELVERVIFPTPSQRAELERLLTGPQYVGGTSVQIQRNLVRRGWAKFFDVAGGEVDDAAKALTAQITVEGKYAEGLKNKRPRHVREISGTYVAPLPRLTRAS